MDLPSGFAQLQAALQALYHHSDASVKEQANQWLQQWQRSELAWQGAHTVLEAPGAGLEAHYFAAQTLRTKVQHNYEELPPAAALGLRDFLLAQLAHFAQGSAPVRTQLCLTLAAMAAHSPATAEALVAQALSMLPSAPSLALELLTAVAEEAEDVGRGWQAGLMSTLLQQAGKVLGAVGSVMQQALQQLGEAATVAAAALRCAGAWLQLSPQPGGVLFTPGELLDRQPLLFGSMLAVLSAERSVDSVVEAAARTLLAVFGSSTFRGDDNADAAAFSRLFAQLVTLRPRLGRASGADTVALSVAQLGSAAAERSPEAACGQMVPEALPFAEAMLDCLSRPESAIAEAAMDYFLMVNTVPLAERPPQLGAPLFQAMLARLLPHVTYPAAFSTWAACSGVDREEFARLREIVLPEALEVTYGLLRCTYLAQALQLLQAAESWQAAEAPLFLVGAVALPLRARALLDLKAASDPSVAEDNERTGQLLVALFARLCAPDAVAGALSSHPALAQSLCWLLERFAPWFGRREEAPLADALQCLLHVLCVQGAEQAAAKAFQAMCLRCAARLKDPGEVQSLIASAHLAAAALALDSREPIIEGLARLAAGLPAESVQGAALQLTQPFLDQARAGVASAGGGTPSPQACKAVGDGLSLLAASLRFLMPLAGSGSSGGSGGGGPAVRVLRSADTLLATVAQAPEWQSNVQASSALVDVYKQAVCSARKEGAELLPAVVPAVCSVFAATSLPACLDVFSEALEVHFQNAGAVQLMLGALRSACAVAFPALQGARLREQGDLAAALLSLADSFAVYAPAVLWMSSVLPALLSLAVAAAGLREAEPARRALSLLGHLASTHQRAADDEGLTAAHMNAMHAALAAQGEALTEALLRALCDTCPRQHMRCAADCLHNLLLHPVLARHAALWLGSACSCRLLQALGDGQLREEDCRQVCALVAGGLHGPRLVALLVDFGLVARGQNTRDVLLAYEL